jgi:hypothetical protein
VLAQTPNLVESKEKNRSQAFPEIVILTVRSKQLIHDNHTYTSIIQVKPYVFNAFVFHSLLDQTFFETHGIM